MYFQAKMLNNMMVEHPQNLALRHVVTSCTMLTYANIVLKKGLDALSQEALVSQASNYGVRHLKLIILSLHFRKLYKVLLGKL
jgi:hypothetical protein